MNNHLSMSILPHPGEPRQPIQAGLWGGVSWGTGAGRVLQILKERPELAEDVKALLLAVWEAEGLAAVLGERLEAFREWWLTYGTTVEAITRERRRLIEDGLVRLSPRAEAERRAKEQQWHRWAQERKIANGHLT